MRKVRCMSDLYLSTTIGIVYDVVEYNSKENTIRINDNTNILRELQLVYPLNEGEEIVVFKDITAEFRDETITEILN